MKLLVHKNFEKLNCYNNTMFKNLGLIFKDVLSENDKTVISKIANELKSFEVSLFLDNQTIDLDFEVNFLNRDEFSKTVDLILIFGGDGTFLSTARKYLKTSVPMLGVNFGSLGFLADINIDTFKQSINEVMSGEFSINERELVKVCFGSKTMIGLNEVLIHSGSYAQLMRYNLKIDGQDVYEQRSDGLIIATPTGSTAYSLSAGGPIIHPSLDVWTIIPMLPQSISSRPFVISSNEKVEMELFEGPSENAKICVDGQKDIDVPYGLNISISKTKKTLKLVHPKDNDFFEACREKLGWSLNLSKK